MENNKNKPKNIQRIVDFWTEKLFNTRSSFELNTNSEKIGEGVFVWSNILNVQQNKVHQSQDFKKVFSDKIEKCYPHIHISSQGVPKGILKETLRDLNMNIDINKSIKSFSTWIENDKVFLREGNNAPQIIDSDEPTISS